MRKIESALRGVTLVELIVVLVIIAIMVGLLLPAVQSAREASRRAECQSNLRQLGIAITEFAVAKKRLPDPPVGGTMSGWAIEILPFIEETSLADGLSGSPPLNSPAALALAKNRPPVMRCPSGYDGDSDIVGIPVSHYEASIYRGPRSKSREWYWSIGELATDSRIPWVVSPEPSGVVADTPISLMPHNGGENRVSTDEFGLVHVEFHSQH